MRILITGSAGSVGVPLCMQLKENGHTVGGVDLQHSHKLQHYRADVGEYSQIARVIQRFEPDMVYHLAAEFGRRNGEDFPEQLWKTNAVGTKNLIRLHREYGFKLVHYSSSEIYGNYPELMTENLPNVIPIQQLNDYAISKWANELQILNEQDRDDQSEIVRVRLFNTYGPGEYYNPYRSAICQFVYKAIHNQPYQVYENYWRTSTYIDDSVKTQAAIADNFCPGEVYNIAGTVFHDIKEVSDIVLDYLGMDDSLVKYLPEDPYNTASKKKPDISKAVRDLGHAPKIGLKEGIIRTIEWQRKIYGKDQERADTAGPRPATR